MGRIAFFIIGATLASTLAFAEITGGGGGLSLSAIISSLTGVFAKLDLQNTFTISQEIQVDGTDERVGLNITKDGEQRSAMCLSRDAANSGTTRSFCLESDKYIMRIVGNNNNIFGTSTSSTVISTFDYNGGGRVNSVPTGAMGVASGNNGTFNTGVAFSVGGTTDTTSTFLVDATNDWTKQLPITAPASTECDSSDEAGRLFFDSTSNAYRSCTGAEWTAGVQDHFVRFSSTAATANVWSDDNIQLGWSGSTGFDPRLTISDFGTGGGFITFNCFSENHTTSGSVNTAGPHDIYTTGLLSTGAMVKCTITADYGSYPQYNLTWFNADKAGPNGTATLRIEKVGQ